MIEGAQQKSSSLRKKILEKRKWNENRGKHWYKEEDVQKRGRTTADNVAKTNRVRKNRREESFVISFNEWRK